MNSTNRKPRILFVAPFQISIRNLLSTGLAHACVTCLDADVVFATPYDAAEFTDDWGNSFKNYRVSSRMEKGGLQTPHGTALVLRVICAIRMRMFAREFPDGSYLMHTLARMPTGAGFTIGTWLCWLAAKILTSVFSRNGFVRRRAAVLLESYKPVHADEHRIVSEVMPDAVLLSSNCIYWLDIRFQIEAKRKHIPVISFVQSWDNLFSRGPMMRLPDKLLVWSDIMKEQAVTCHNFPEERIAVVGAMQFVPYARETTRAECDADLAVLGIEPGEPYFLYVPGGATGEYDTEDFMAFYDVVSRSHYRNVKIVFRPHPQSERAAYEVLRGLPIIFDISPNITDPAATATSFDTKDILHMACLLKRAKAVVSSWATTALLEAAIMDRPVLQLRWMHAIPHTNQAQLDRMIMFQRYMHLRDFDTCDARRFCDAPVNLIEDLDHIFEHDERYRSGRRRAVETLVRMPLGQATARTVTALRETLAEAHA